MKEGEVEGNSDDSATFVVVGGGIAGVSCTELLSFICPEESILLLSASPLVKTATDVKQLTPLLEEFEISETPSEKLLIDRPNLRVVTASVTKLDSKNHEVHASNGRKYKYQKLCLATGGKPKIIVENNPRVIGIRDTETVQIFQEKLKNAKRVIVVGNGGIATELVYEIEGCEVIWVIKDTSISATFFDPGAAEFFLPHLTTEKNKSEQPVKRHKYTTEKKSGKDDAVLGSALGPDWSSNLPLKGKTEFSHSVSVEYQCEIMKVIPSEDSKNEKSADKEGEWPIYAELSNGKVIGCDFIISATGVTPFTDPFLDGNMFQLAEDGGFQVNNKMETNISDVFAAGDICHTSWESAKHWFQMRLWTQARQMGAYCAKCMVASFRSEEVVMDFCFELFTHVTKFFGYKVILLGLFNSQKLGKDFEILLRVTKGQEYVKVILQNGRTQGAILIGETDLEEVFENLILNQMDVSRYGEDLLNPDIDIEDYFD